MIHLRTILEAQLFGKQLRNIFYYRDVVADTISTSDLELFNQSWVTQVLTAIEGCTSVQVSYQGIETTVMEQYENTRFYSPRNSNGDIAQDSLPAYFTYYLKGNVNQRFTRPGRKSISGVPEGFYLNETTVTVTDQQAVADMVDAFGYSITIPGFVFLPCVVRLQTPVVGEPPVVVQSQGISDWSFVRFSTQNTRKIGRGI